MIMIRDFNNMFQQMSGMPVGSKGGKNLLRSAGIDTNSKQYQAVIKSMGKAAGGGVAYTNPEAIKNRMKNYDADGDYIDPVTGLSGLTVTEKNVAGKNKIISIPESSREEMFELTKKEFLKNNGVKDGNTTQRMNVYTNLYHKMKKSDRLASGHTLEQYERAYTKAFVDSVKKQTPEWEPGKKIPAGALDTITRESIDNSLTKERGQYGEVLVRKAVDVSV